MSTPRERQPEALKEAVSRPRDSIGRPKGEQRRVRITKQRPLEWRQPLDR